jgi:hypothetical protein
MKEFLGIFINTNPKFIFYLLIAISIIIIVFILIILIILIIIIVVNKAKNIKSFSLGMGGISIEKYDANVSIQDASGTHGRTRTATDKVQRILSP